MQQAAAQAERARIAQQRQSLALQRARERAMRQAQIAQERDERVNKRLHAEMQAQEAVDRSQDVREQLEQVQTLLATGLRRDPHVEFMKFQPPPLSPIWDPTPFGSPEPAPALETFLPDAPHGLRKLRLGSKEKYAVAVQAARETHRQATEAWQAAENERQARIASAYEEHQKQVGAAEEEAQRRAAEIDGFQAAYSGGDPEAIARYNTLVLERSPMPDGFPALRRVAYAPPSRQLVVEVELPTIDVVPAEREYRYVKAKDVIEPVYRPERERRPFYLDAIAQTMLRVLSDLVRADWSGAVDSLVLNGYVSTINPATGQQVRPCLITLRTTVDIVTQLDLSRVDAVACLKTLNAGVSASPAELAAVRPILEFSMVDPRFIEETDILSTLDQRPNLMEMSPGEFENLITNLFEKMGLETRLTRPSRDGGVDCVAYDSRPIVGGKVVIQAKRYKNTVGVSAVRDLYGTTMNEGAAKGILVTTSGYGKASFEFAANKPLELLDGAICSPC